MTPGRAGTMSQDYKRNGTTDLSAALKVATEPFVWHKTAVEIIESVRRGRASLTQIKFAKRH